MLNNRVTTPVFCCVLPSIVLPSIPSPISRQCHLTPASLSCRQTKWFHNQYERRCNPACFHTLKQTGNNWNRPANQIRNNQCNKYESAYCKMSQCPYRKLPGGKPRCQAWQAVLFCQSECANPALKQHEWPVRMLLFELIFLLLRLLCISEQLAGGPYLNFCTADHCTMILRDQVNIRPMSTA